MFSQPTKKQNTNDSLISPNQVGTLQGFEVVQPKHVAQLECGYFTDTLTARLSNNGSIDTKINSGH